MSTIIRDAIIRLRIEQQKANLESPSSGIGAVYKAEAKAATEAKKATDDATRAAKEHGRVVAQTSYQTIASFREGGEGALRMARGIAFLSASGSESLQKLMQKVALTQGAFDVFAGGFKMATNLAAAFGPLGIAVAGVTAAVAVGAVAWNHYTASMEEAAAAARKRAEDARLAAEQERRLQETIIGIEAAARARSTGVSLTNQEKTRRENIELTEINQRAKEAAQETKNLAAGQRQAKEEMKELERLRSEPIKATGRNDWSGTAKRVAEIEALEPKAAEARQRSEDYLTRQIALQKQLTSDQQRALEITLQRNREQTEQSASQLTAFGAAGGSALGFGQLANAGFAQGISQLESVRTKFVAEIQGELDKIVEAFRKSTTQLAKFEKEMDQAHPD